MDQRLLSGRRLVDLGAAAAQRLRQRMADAADDTAFGRPVIDARSRSSLRSRARSLALTAGLAVTCFVKVFAMGFLGMPRSEGAAEATEAGLGTGHRSRCSPRLCILLGVLPTYVIPAIDRAVVPLAHESATAALVPPFFSVDAAATGKSSADIPRRIS